jgi:hypothetical protein
LPLTASFPLPSALHLLTRPMVGAGCTTVVHASASYDVCASALGVRSIATASKKTVETVVFPLFMGAWQAFAYKYLPSGPFKNIYIRIVLV